MQTPLNHHRYSLWPSLVGLTALLFACSRGYYREDADKEVTQIIDEKSKDPRWSLKGFKIDMDPKGRFYDPANPDYPPMPPDDPAANELMVSVDGKDGYAHWLDHGQIEGGAKARLENPDWRKFLADELTYTPDGKVKLRLEDAVRLALRHAPGYQQTLETLYLSALDVSTERYRFDVQFFGGFGAGVEHRGSENPGGESNTADITPDGSIRRRFAAAGELLVTLANSIGWEFFGPNDGFSTSQLGFSLVQPLLRGGGRVVALEQLTIAERALLANLRAFQIYRQGFYTQIAVGQGGGGGPQRRGGFFGGTGLTGFTGQGSGGFGGVGDATGFGRGGFGGGGGGGAAAGAGFAGGGAGTVGGFIGLLQQTQQIRNTRDSLNAQLRTLALLESNLEAGFIDIAQVDQFRQNIETERASLLQAQNGLASGLDTFLRSTLGLPPNVPIEPDDSLIQPFQLIDPSMTDVQNAVTALMDRFGELPEQPGLDRLRATLDEIDALRRRIAGQLELIPKDLRALDEKTPVRKRTLSADEQKAFDDDRKRMGDDLEELKTHFAETAAELEALRAGARDDTATRTADGIVDLLTALSNLMGEISLVQARARLEMITVDPIKLTADQALEIARAERLDWMNNRAALVDTWRLIEFNANALKSNLTVRLSGDITTQGQNTPFKFRDETGSVRAALEWDGPFTRLAERNNFRQQLIQYQQDRRQLIQFEDGVLQSMRAALRSLEQLRVNLEIQRRAVTIAIRRVDQTREALNRPVPPAAPGQPPQALGPTSAQNLLFALSDLRTTQNNLMSVWLNYSAGRMGLYQQLGVMRLDQNNLWIDEPLEDALRIAAQDEPLPPEIPEDIIETAKAGLEASTAPQNRSNANVPSPPLAKESEAYRELPE